MIECAYWIGVVFGFAAGVSVSLVVVLWAGLLWMRYGLRGQQ